MHDPTKHALYTDVAILSTKKVRRERLNEVASWGCLLDRELVAFDLEFEAIKKDWFCVRKGSIKGQEGIKIVSSADEFAFICSCCYVFFANNIVPYHRNNALELSLSVMNTGNEHKLVTIKSLKEFINTRFEIHKYYFFIYTYI